MRNPLKVLGWGLISGTLLVIFVPALAVVALLALMVSVVGTRYGRRRTLYYDAEALRSVMPTAEAEVLRDVA